jgi:hypothetical protein
METDMDIMGMDFGRCFMDMDTDTDTERDTATATDTIMVMVNTTETKGTTRMKSNTWTYTTATEVVTVAIIMPTSYTRNITSSITMVQYGMGKIIKLNTCQLAYMVYKLFMSTSKPYVND